MSDPTDSTSRSIALRGTRSLSAVRNSLISRGLAQLAEFSASSPMPSAPSADIHYAATNGYNDTIRQILLNDPVSIDARDQHGRTPLDLAAQFGHIKTVEMLLAKGADTSARDESDLAPLHHAAAGGRPTVVEALLSHGEDVDVRDKSERTPLHVAALATNDIRPTRNADGTVGTVVLSDFPATAEFLLSHRADVNSRDASGFTPAHYAAKTGGWRGDELLAVLLSHGADVSAKDDNGRTALHAAAQGDNSEEIELLIEYGAEVNRKDDKGATPLDYARDEFTAKTLRQHGGVSGKAVR